MVVKWFSEVKADSCSFSVKLVHIVYIMMFCLTAEADNDVTTTISQFMNNYSIWTSEQLQLITDYFNNKYALSCSTHYVSNIIITVWNFMLMLIT